MNLDSALKQLSEFLKTVKFGQPEPGLMKDEPLVVVSRGEVTVIFTGVAAEEYSSAVHDIYQAVGKKETVSEAVVSNLVSDIATRLFADGDQRGTGKFDAELKKELQALKDSLTAPLVEWDVYVRLVGPAPSELPVQIGKVEFILADEKTLELLDHRTREVIGPNKDVPEDKKDAFYAWTAKETKTHYFGHAIAKISVEALDFAAAKALALRVVQRTVDSINFFADKRLGNWLYIPGQASSGVELFVGFATKGAPMAKYTTSPVGPRRSMPLRQIAEARGFARLSQLLADSKPNSLTDRILTAVQWAGRARVEERREEAFLLYAISLETLLLGNKVDIEISHRLALRAVHLLAAADMQSRRLVQKQIKQLYTTRSKIVHSGSFQVTNIDLELMSKCARLAVFMMLDAAPFATMVAEEDLETWFEEQILGRPPADTGAALVEAPTAK